MEPNYHRLGGVVRARRVKLGLSQAGVEQRGGPSELTIRKIERGQLSGPLRLQTLQRLDQALDWKPGTCMAILDGTAGDDPDAWVLTDAAWGASAPATGGATAGVTPAGTPDASQVGNAKVTVGEYLSQALGHPPSARELEFASVLPKARLLLNVPELIERAALLDELMRSAQVLSTEGNLVNVSVSPDLWHRIKASTKAEPIDMQRVASAVAELWRLPSTPEIERIKAGLVGMLHQAVEVRQAVEVNSAGGITPHKTTHGSETVGPG